MKSETNQENLPGLVVTRSTSPIQTDIIKSILKEDNIIHNTHDNDYTIHIKSYQPLNNQVKDLPLSEHDGIYDPIYDNPPKNEEYYSTLLRDRLRHILLDYNSNNKERIPENIEVEVERTDYEDINSSLEEYNNKKKRNNYANNYNERKYLRRITNNQSKSQYNQCNHHNHTTSTSTTTANNTTEELMKSMAQIMTAVGNIVSKPKPLKYKSVLKKYQLQHQQHYYENNEGCSSNIQYTQHNSDSSNSRNMQYNHNNRNYKDYNHQNNNIHCSQHNIHHNSSKQCKQPIAQMTSPSIAQMMLQPAGAPRNKAAMIDMILMKIQVITVTIAFYY